MIGWFSAAFCLLWIVYGLYNVQLSPFAAAAFSSLSHTAWALSLAWIVVACSSGYGGYVNKLLSLPLLYPFSRVTYCAYLVHPISIRFVSLGSDATIHLGNDSVVSRPFFRLIMAARTKFISRKLNLLFHALLLFTSMCFFYKISDGCLFRSLGVVVHLGFHHFIVIRGSGGDDAQNTHTKSQENHRRE